jgi:hypothetical protein
MITYLKSETERLEKGCGKDWFDSDTGGLYECCVDDNELCPTCQAKLSTLIKTSWIFARKVGKEILEFAVNPCYCLDFNGYTCDFCIFKNGLQEIISYCKAKAKEHKIELNDGGLE